MSDQVGLFVRRSPGTEWVWEGFFPDGNRATMFYNLVEMEYPEADAFLVWPDEVFDNMTRLEEEDG